MRHSRFRGILVYLFKVGKEVIAVRIHRKEADDGLVSYPTHGRRATDRQ